MKHAEPTTKETRRDAIVRIFETMDGPAPVVEIARRCMEEGLWSREENDRAIFRARCGEVRDVLNDVGVDGLPRAIQKRVEIEVDAEGEIEKVHLWYQKEFWTEDLARNWLSHRRKQLRSDHEAMLRFVEHAKKRWPGTDWTSLVPEVSW